MPDTPETEAAAKRLAQIAHTENLAKLIGIFMTLALVVVLIVVNLSLLSRQSDLVASSRRADCRSGIVATYNEVQKDDFKTLLQVVFTHHPAGTPLTAAENETITHANDRLSKLPPFRQAVEHGYTLDGVHYPPCPTVG